MSHWYEIQCFRNYTNKFLIVWIYLLCSFIYLELALKALSRFQNHPLSQICHSSAGSEDTEDRFLAVKWFLDGELLKEITLAPQCQNSSNDDPKCNVDPSKIILGLNPKCTIRVC